MSQHLVGNDVVAAQLVFRRSSYRVATASPTTWPSVRLHAWASFDSRRLPRSAPQQRRERHSPGFRETQNDSAAS